MEGRGGQGRVPDCLGGLSRVGISSRSTRPWNGQPPSMTLYILDIIHGKFQTHTIHISSVTVDQILALKWPIWSID